MSLRLHVGQEPQPTSLNTRSATSIRVFAAVVFEGAGRSEARRIVVYGHGLTLTRSRWTPDSGGDPGGRRPGWVVRRSIPRSSGVRLWTGPYVGPARGRRRPLARCDRLDVAQLVEGRPRGVAVPRTRMRCRSRSCPKRLRKENIELRTDREILRKAAAYFARVKTNAVSRYRFVEDHRDALRREAAVSAGRGVDVRVLRLAQAAAVAAGGRRR